MNPFRQFKPGDVLCKIGYAEKYLVEEVCFQYYACVRMRDGSRWDIVKKFAHNDYVMLENVYENDEI